MAYITANGRPVVAMRLTMPAIGVWVAELEVDSDEALEGAVTIAGEGTEHVGTAVRSGVIAEVCRAEVVGGAGGLAGEVDARSYRSATVRVVLEELLAAAGERLSGASASSALSRSLGYWTRPKGRAGAALGMLVDSIGGAVWRVLAEGSVWVGIETWPDAPSTAFGDELDRDHAAGTVLIAPDAPGLAPGMSLAGDHVARVEHSMGPARPLRTRYWVAA